MVDKRQDYEKQLSKHSTAKDRITEQLETSEAQVTRLQGVVNVEMMQNGTSDSLQELSLARERVTSLHQALQYASSQVNAAQQQLEDYDRAVRGGEAIALDKKLQQAIVNLQGLIGERGLKHEVDELWSLIEQLNHMSNANVETHVTQANIICVDLSRALFETWNRIEQLKWGPQHSPEVINDRIPGFGLRV